MSEILSRHPGGVRRTGTGREGSCEQQKNEGDENAAARMLHEGCVRFCAGCGGGKGRGQTGPIAWRISHHTPPSPQRAGYPFYHDLSARWLVVVIDAAASFFLRIILRVQLKRLAMCRSSLNVDMVTDIDERSYQSFLRDPEPE